MKKGETEINKLLWSFSEKVVSKLDEYRKEGGLLSEPVTYEVAKLTAFEYKDGNISHTTSFNLEKRQVLSWANQFHYIDNELKTLDEYSSLVEKLAEYYEESSFWADFHLIQYIHALVRKAVNPLSGEDLNQIIVQFLKILENSPQQMHIQAWIEGILIDSEAYTIHKGIKLRRIQKSDLEYENMLTPTILHKKPPKVTPVILEMKIRGRETREAQEELDLILSILRLYRVGCVYSSHTKIEKESSLWGGFVTTGDGRICSLRYTLSSDELDNLSAFIDRMYTITPSVLKRMDSEKITPMDVSFDRYNEGIAKSYPVEASIASTISCMESLLFRENEQSELARTLAQRVASLLQHFGLNPVEVYNKMKRAYDIRSRYVHGGFVEKKQRGNLGDFRKSILNFARLCLIVYLQINDKQRTSLISQLDNSLLSDTAKTRVAETVSKLIVS